MARFKGTTRSISAAQRLIALKDDAYDVRQLAIRDGGDLDAWRLARRMREATSPQHAASAERQFRAWQIRSPGRPG